MKFFSKEPENVREVVIITEMCDVCGHSCDMTQIRRTTLFSKGGTRFVIRHHPTCNPYYYFNMISHD